MFDRILDTAELQQQSSISSSGSNEQQVAAVLRSVAELGEAKRVLLVSQSAAVSAATAALQQALTAGVGSSGSVVTVSRCSSSSSSNNVDTDSSATATWDGTVAGLSAALQAAQQSTAAAAAVYDLISLDVKGCCYLPQGKCELYDTLMLSSAVVLCKSGLLAVPLAALTSEEQQALIAHVDKDRARVEYATLPLAGGVLFIRWKGG
jgi:hypothetical protein